MAKNFRKMVVGAAIVGAGILARVLITRESTGGEVGKRSADLPSERKDAPLEQLVEDPGLATLGEVEAAITKVEGVQVAFVHRDTMRDARSNKRGFDPYPYKNKLSGDYTVTDLINQRLAHLYDHHGLRIVVKYANGEVAMGGTRLRTVRDGG